MEMMGAEHKEVVIKKDITVDKARTVVAHAQRETQKRDNDNTMLKIELSQLGAQQKKQKNGSEGYLSSKKRRRSKSPYVRSPKANESMLTMRSQS